jgi:hypothetical protein
MSNAPGLEAIGCVSPWPSSSSSFETFWSIVRPSSMISATGGDINKTRLRVWACCTKEAVLALAVAQWTAATLEGPSPQSRFAISRQLSSRFGSQFRDNTTAQTFWSLKKEDTHPKRYDYLVLSSIPHFCCIKPLISFMRQISACPDYCAESFFSVCHAWSCYSPATLLALDASWH